MAYYKFWEIKDDGKNGVCYIKDLIESMDIKAEVRHWIMPSFGHMWNIYVSVYPNHPLFSQLPDPDLDGYDSANDFINFHGGTTYGQWDIDHNAKVFGCDYAHYSDERFQGFGTPDEAAEVFADATDILADLLSKR